MATTVRIGDYVICRNIKNRLNLMAEGILNDDIYIGKSDCGEDSWFQICLPRQYTAAVELDEFLNMEEENGEVEMSVSTKRHLDALERGYLNEQKLNEQYMANKFGTPVRYGDTIQLLHVKSKKYVTVVSREVAYVEKENIRVKLDTHGTTESWLTVQPRFKINQTGDVLMSNAEIKLNVAVRPNEYLHAAESGTQYRREVNSSLEPTSWLIGIYQSSLNSQDKNTILTSDLVYLSDPETKSVLSVFQRPPAIYPYGTDHEDEMSDDDSMMELSEEGEIVMEKMSKSVRTSALWMIQSKLPYIGGPIEWRTEQVRLQHVNTGKYLCFSRAKDADGKTEGFEPYELKVSSNPQGDKGTLISIHELHATNSHLEDKRAVQLSHGHTFIERGEIREVGSVSHHTCVGTRTKATATCLFIHKYDSDKVTQSLQAGKKARATPIDLVQQPLDVFVGSSIRKTLGIYYAAFANFDRIGENDSTVDDDEMSVVPLERIWTLPEARDKIFYNMIDRAVYYMKGMTAGEEAPAIDDPTADEDDEAVNEFGEKLRNDALICKRQNMACDQGTIGIVLCMLNDLLKIVKKEECAEHWEAVIADKKTSVDNSSLLEYEENEHTKILKNLLHMTAKVSKALFTLLLQCVKRHPGNQMYVAGHMHVVLGWVGIQPIAADVVRQMLSNNLELQSEHIGPNEIKIFTDQLCHGDTKLKSMYFAMLKAFCSCAGNGISRNQQFVMDALIPEIGNIFVTIYEDQSADAESDKLQFANSLYMPPGNMDRQDQNNILGARILVEGMPFLSVTWRTNQKDFLPSTLFGKDIVALSELFRSTKANRDHDALILGSLTTTSAKRSPVKRARSGSFIDTNQRRRMMSVSATNSYGSLPTNQQLNYFNLTLERKQVMIGYIVAQLDLVSELCLDRNYMAIAHMEKLFPYECLLSILSGSGLTSSALTNERIPELIGAASRLIKSLYVDRESESTCRMPCMTILASSLDDGQPQLACVEEAHKHRFSLLQHILSEHVKNMPTNGGAWSTSSLHMACLMKKLVQLQFYGSEEKLRDVIVPLMTVLNRKNPELDSNAFAWTKQNKSARSLRDLVPSWQKSMLKFLESITELVLVMTVVIASTAVSIAQVIGGYSSRGFQIFDIIVLLFFAAEVSMRGYCHHYVRKNWNKFFKDHFVQLDIGIVLLDVIVMGSEDALGSVGSFSSTLRALRLLRLVRVVRAARILKGIAKKELEVAEKWALPERYRTAPLHELQTMVEMVDILSAVQRLLDDRNIRFLVKGFYDWSSAIENSQGREIDATKAVATFVATSAQARVLQVGSSEYDDVLLDILMYVHPDLTQSVLDLLMAHHSSINKSLERATSIQILASPHREKQFHLVHDLLLKLDRNIETFALWNEVNTAEHKQIADSNIEILNVLKENCRSRAKVLKFNEVYEPDVTVQHMLRNFGCWDVILKMLKKLEMSFDDNTMSKGNRSTTAIMCAANQMLYWYVYGNAVNQAEVFEELEFFFNTVDRHIDSHNVITAVFFENEALMRKVPVHRIAEFAEKITKIGRFPQYLTLMSAITCVGDRNILENQYEIVKQIASPLRQKKILAFCVPISHPDYGRKQKLMAPYLQKVDISPDEIAAELSYHIQLLRVFSGCTVGVYNITTIETKVQAMFNYVDVIDAILDKQCMMIIKIETGLFLYNSLLEVEMQLPGLAFSPSIWKLLEACVDTFATAKDDLRNAERNGWDAPTVSRQKIEFVIVCVMIVKGFFRVYFDPVGFKREHLASFGTPSNKLEYSMKHIEGIISSLFDLIQGIYEMDSPIISDLHKQMMWKSLEALAKAKSVKLTDYVQNIHTDANKTELELALMEVSETDRLEKALSRNLSKFMECLSKDSTVKEILRNEFQSLIDKLDALPRVTDVTSTSTVRYEPLLKKLVDHFKSATVTVVHGSGREKHMNARTTNTAIWIIRMFRTMIENAWGMTIYERDDDGGEEQDDASASLVQTFNTCGATTLCLDLIAAGIDRELVNECVKFGVAMLFKEGGSLAVQRTMHTYLSSTDSELFFSQLRKTIQELVSWHEWRGVTYLQEGEEVDLPEEIITVRFMQLMCEGHFMPNQDIMREQDGKRVSINLLDDLVNYLVVLSRMPCRTSTTAALAVGATVLEVIQGPCEGNQNYFALNTSLIETLNHQMRAQVIGDCDVSEELELKKTGIDIFQGLLEGQGHKTVVYERVLSVIHLDVIQMLCGPQEGEDKHKEESADANSSQDNVDAEDGGDGDEEDGGDGNGADEEEDIEVVLRTESLVLLQMLCDFKPSLRDELDVMKTDAIGAGGGVACVEIMWRGELQRRFFNVPSICKNFPDSAKAHFVANVNRESQEKKLLDMYVRARVIYTELLHHKFLHEINISGIFSRQNQNLATWITFILCCSINLIMLAYFDGSECFEKDTKCGEPRLNQKARNAVNILNILQIVFSSFTLVLFLIVKAPVQFATYRKAGLGLLKAALFTAVDPYTLYYFVYVIMAVMSYTIDHIVTILLLDIVMKNSYAMDVLIAIFTPIKQLAMACLLCVVVMYIFSMILVSVLPILWACLIFIWII